MGSHHVPGSSSTYTLGTAQLSPGASGFCEGTFSFEHLLIFISTYILCHESVPSDKDRRRLQFHSLAQARHWAPFRDTLINSQTKWRSTEGVGSQSESACDRLHFN